MSIKLWHYVIILLLIYFFVADYNYAQTNKEIAKSHETLDFETLQKTISHHEDIIVKYPDEVFIPNIMFELAELYVTRSEIEFKNQMTQYDEQIKKYDKGEIATEPILPRICFKGAIETCYKLLEKFPNTGYRDKVIYRLAMCHLDEGNQEKAKEYFQKLIYECPQSPKISEAHFRLGEYYFNKRDFNTAIEQYKNLLESWDDPYFNMALYKLGWSYFNINDYTNALSTYIYLISDIKLLEELDTELLGKTKADVKNEAIEYIAHSFCECGGASLAKSILKTKSTQEYAILVLEKMGEIYKKRNFYPEAIATYEALLELYPFYPYAPNIQREIIQCYEKDFQEDKTNEAKETFIEKYGPDSKWIAQYPEGKTRNDALALVQEMSFSLGTYYQAKAQEKNREREYLLAIEKYKDYLKKFKNSKMAQKVNYYLAECYYEIGDYDHAADEYFKVMNNYDEKEFKDIAAYNRILSYYQLLKQNPKADSVTFYLEDFLGRSDQLPTPIRVGHEDQANLIRACNDYVRFLPESDKTLEVLMKYGEILYELNKWDLAEKVYRKVVDEKNKNSIFYGPALNMLAQCYFKMNNYQEAEKWYQELVIAFPDSAKYIEKAQKMIASANFKEAEALGQEGKSVKAAAEFLKLAFGSKDADIAKAAIFEAANYFEKSDDIEMAVRAYERMIEEQPQIAFIDELLCKAAALREKMENWLRASEHYLKLVQVKPMSNLAPIALFNAAACFENMKLWHKAIETYQRYVMNYPNLEPDKCLDAQCKIGEIYHNQLKDEDAALAEFEKVVKKYNEFNQRRIQSDEYLAAKAQYMIAEIYFNKYKQIKLIPPLQKSLAKKKELLAEVLKAYVETGKFKVADWATASLYKAGQTFEELCDALLTSPTPSELSQEEIDQYYENLKQQLIPFKEKALEFYKSNVANAEKNNIKNEWTEESKKRMEALIVELGIDHSESSPTKTNYISSQSKNEGS